MTIIFDRSRRLARWTGTLVLAAGFVAAGASLPRLAPQAEAGQAGVSETGNGQRVKLGLNKSIVVDLPADAYDILVANPAVADAVTRTARRIYLFGKSVGQTNIFVFGPNGEQVASLYTGLNLKANY